MLKIESTGSGRTSVSSEFRAAGNEKTGGARLRNCPQNLKMALAEIIFALARPVQGAGRLGLHSSPTLPKFSYSMRTPLSLSKKYCAPKPLRRLVSLNWRPGLLEPATKPLLYKVNLVWQKNAPNRPKTERLLV